MIYTVTHGSATRGKKFRHKVRAKQYAAKQRAAHPGRKYRIKKRRAR